MRASFMLRLVAVGFTSGLTLWIGSACGDSAKGDDTGEATVVDTGSCFYSAVCSGQATNLAMTNPDYLEISAMCFEGVSDVGLPTINVTVPQVVPYNASNTWDDWDGCNYTVTVANVSGPLVNDFVNDGRIWDWSFTSCDYSDPTVRWYRLNVDNSQGWWPWFAGCPIVIQPIAIYPTGKVPSPSTTCTAGSATYDLRLLNVTQGSSISGLARWVPVARTSTKVPERAWLSRIEVTNWGSVTNLHMSSGTEFGTLVYNGPEIQNSVELTNTGASSMVFASGDQPFMSVLSSERVDFMAVGFTEPTVKLDWTCGTSNPSHFAPPVGMTGHAGGFPASYGINHRFVIWVNSTKTEARATLEGRFADNVKSSLTPAAGGGYNFSFYIDAYDAIVAGKLVVNGTSYKVQNGTVTIGTGTPIAFATITLTKLP